jgi:hypothetical protein
MASTMDAFLTANAYGISTLMSRVRGSALGHAPRQPRSISLLVLGVAATVVCLVAELWLMQELLALLPEGNADPAEIEHLADIGKAIAGATGATLVVRGLLDRTARNRGRVGVPYSIAFAALWLIVTASIYQSLVVVTEAIVDSLPQVTRQDAVLIALYRKNVQDGLIGDPDFSPGKGGTLDDLNRVKTINAAIGLLDRERDYARRSETALRDAADIRKADIVRTAEGEAAAVRTRFDSIRRPFNDLAEGRTTAPALAAWSAYDGLWKMPPEQRASVLASGDVEIVPAFPQSSIRALRLGDIAPGLSPESFGRFVAGAIATRRDAALWAIEDRVLSALEAVNRSASIFLDPATERQLVVSIVVPPLALSFGAIGIIANASALVLLGGSLAVVLLFGTSTGPLRGFRLASVVVPWLAVASVIVLAPPVPFDEVSNDGRSFSRILRQARTVEAPLWTDLWLRMIGIEARLLGSMPGRG